MILLIAMIQVRCNSQPVGKLRQLWLSVNNIKYDDAGFTALREKLQNDKTVTSLKESFSNGTATITFTCTRSAISLWDNIPASFKKPFTVSSIDGQHIVLSGSGSTTTADTTSTSGSSAAAANNDDCKTCYYNLCKYDETKTFQGVAYKGINYDQGTYFYNCDNGVVTRKIIQQNAYGTLTGIRTDTLIMSNVPAGTTWGVNQSGGGSNYSGYTLIAKNVSVNVNNTQYNDVIIVNIRQYNQIMGTGSSVNYYYARGKGPITSEKLDYKKDPMQAYQSELQSLATASSLQGVIDPGLTGAWRWVDPDGSLDCIYKFNSDGTFNYYVGNSVANGDEMYANGKNYWRLDGNTLNVYYSGMNKKWYYRLQKIKDAASGKPALGIQVTSTQTRNFVSIDPSK